jgi:hypothetical protein
VLFAVRQGIFAPTRQSTWVNWSSPRSAGTFQGKMLPCPSIMAPSDTPLRRPGPLADKDRARVADRRSRTQAGSGIPRKLLSYKRTPLDHNGARNRRLAVRLRVADPARPAREESARMSSAPPRATRPACATHGPARRHQTVLTAPTLGGARRQQTAVTAATATPPGRARRQQTEPRQGGGSLSVLLDRSCIARDRLELRKHRVELEAVTTPPGASGGSPGARSGNNPVGFPAAPWHNSPS